MGACDDNAAWTWQGGHLQHKTTGLCLVVNATVTGSAEQSGFSDGAQVRVFTCPSGLKDPNYPEDFDVRSEWVMNGAANSTATFQLKLGGGGASFGGQSTSCAGEVCLPPTNLALYPSWIWAHFLMGRTERAAAAAQGPQPSVDVYDSLPQVGTTWVGTQMMVHDRFFFDHSNYSVTRYLDDLKARFGGIDQVLLWATYPNIGIDNRGAADMMMSLPGGLTGLRDVVDQFQKAGVMVMLPYHPFDAGTSSRERQLANHSLTDAVEMAELLKLTGADGLNGDTNRGVPYSFFLEGQRITGKSIVLQPEQGVAGVAGLNYNSMSWIYGFQKLNASDLRLSSAKFVEPRHRGHICDRWSQDQTAAILNAYFNGLGFVAWENVWGMWNELTPRTGELLRRVAALQRHFSRILQLRNDSFWPFFNAFPLEMRGPDGRNVSSIEAVRVTRFYAANESLFAVVTGLEVNRKSSWPLAINYHIQGTRYYDFYHGTELNVTVVPSCLTSDSSKVTLESCHAGRADQSWSLENHTLRQGELCLVFEGASLFMGDCSASAWTQEQQTLQTPGGLCLNVDPAVRGRGQGAAIAVAACETIDRRSQWVVANGTIQTGLEASATAWLDFELEPLAIGAVLSIAPNQQLSPSDAEFLDTMRTMTARPLSEFPTHWEGNLPQNLVVQPSPAPMEGVVAGMVRVEEEDCSTWTFKVTGMEIEGEDRYGVDVQYPWEKAAQRVHQHTFSLGPSGSLAPFYLDKNLVTKGDYFKFINASGYKPADAGNYLKDWEGDQPSLPEAPVVWVSRLDAQNYCAHHGKRLPEEWEWQLAAGGCENRLYPWGDAPPEYGTHIPPLFPGRQDYNASPIGSFPQGASANGILDLAGNVWQWTSLFEDAHTRGAILRGGTVFRPGIGGTGDPESVRHEVNYMWFGDWYFPGGLDTVHGPEPWGIRKYPDAFQLQNHAKLLMMSPSLDRSGAIGFRCAASAVPPASPHKDADWIWILVPAGALLLSALCIGGMFYQRFRQKLRGAPLLNKNGHVALPQGSSYRSLGYDADVSNASGVSQGR